MTLRLRCMGAFGSAGGEADKADWAVGWWV